ncbi:hypothetical protein B0H16DRAFT_1625173 [Mycena metata]|uniref:F-box domain-containing protein n=1 Tax=Mycena metata TaxID=1033252 RepID=A0AAD7H5D3_9AGAR|nr:hypothetical protein B0H16DRAFT_1625173 [Mycena metata]
MLNAEGYSATEDKRSEMQTQLLEAEVELINFEGEFFNLPDPFGELAAEREDLERKVSDLRAELAPHRRLPPELLVEIFLFCTAETVSLPPSSDETRLILTQICHSWRDLALQTPELWGNIAVVFTEDQCNVELITTISAQWLARAGDTYPLCIAAECTGVYATTACQSPELVAAFVPMVISHSHHLRSLDLGFPIAALLPLFALPSGAFPCLEKMSLRPLLVLDDMDTPEAGSSLGWHWPSTAVVLDSAPRIQEVTFSPSPLFKLAELESVSANVMEQAMTDPGVGSHPFFAPEFSLPWSKLSIVAFPFTALTPQAWCSILIQCPKLQRFEIAIKPSTTTDRESSHTSGSLQQIQLDHLIHLSISAFCGGADELVDRLTAPSLNQLSLMGTEFPTACLLSFQRRSNFALETFIPVIPIPAADVERILEHMPDLKMLIILAISTEHFPASLWERVGRGELLPQLETMLIRPTPVQAPDLVDMIAARWEANGAGRGPMLGFCDVRPAHLEAIMTELNRLEKYADRGQSVQLLTLC